jgi:hypothetical protein
MVGSDVGWDNSSQGIPILLLVALVPPSGRQIKRQPLDTRSARDGWARSVVLLATCGGVLGWARGRAPAAASRVIRWHRIAVLTIVLLPASRPAFDCFVLSNLRATCCWGIWRCLAARLK